MLLIQQLINGITQGSLYALLAISFSLIFGVLKLVNFAVGEVYMFGAFVGWLVVRFVSANIFLALAASIITGWVLGYIIEKVAFKALRGVPEIASLICTIGFSIFLKEIASVIFGAETQSVPGVFEKVAFTVSGASVSLLEIFLVSSTAIILILLQFLIYRTKMGLAVRTVSLDYKTAGLMGINVDKVISFTFSLGGSLGAVAGVLASIYYNAVFPTMGSISGLKAFAAAVFGGLTSIPGAILGGYLLGIIENLAVQVISSGYRDIIGFVILVGFLLFRPRGILGKKSRL